MPLNKIKYIPVEWPESQKFMEHSHFREECYYCLVASIYFVPENLYDEVMYPPYHLPEEYPGSYIGVSEEEYSLIIRAIESEEYSLCDWWNPLYFEREGYFVVFEGITVTYIDENNAEHKVKIS